MNNADTIASTSLDAENNWWDDTNGPTHSGNTFNVSSQGDAVTDDVDYVPWYNTNKDGTTFAPVNNITDGNKFSSIQAAIDAATVGNTISVAAGTYTENPAVSKSLTLSGPNAAISPNTGTRVTEAIIDGRIVVGITAGVTIQGFNFSVTPGVAGIATSPTLSGTGDVTDLSILKNSFAATSETQSVYPAIDIDVDWGDSVTGLLIDDNLITDVRGIIVSDWNVTDPNASVHAVTITDNVIIGGSTTTAFAGISVDTVSGVISGNTISNIYDAGINVGTSNYLACTDLTITDNTVTNAGTATWGNAGAINLYSDSTDITITYNTLADSYDGITIKDMGVALGSGIAINYNDISGNSNYGLYMLGLTGTLDAKYNWWGGVAGPVTSPVTNPYNAAAVTQSNDTVSANVDYLPWMIHNTLVSGWNIYSTPIAPSTSTNTIAKALDLWTTDTGSYTIGWYFNGATQAWVQVVSATALQPMQAVYLKMTAAATIDVVLSAEYTSPPQVVMGDGWNLVGPAALEPMAVDDALLSAWFGAGDLWGYSQAYSPALHQTLWTVQRVAVNPTEQLIPTEGYWVHMVNEGLLAGFTSTPITLAP